MALNAIRILVIEDDQKIASFMAKGLKEEGFAVDVQRDETEGLLAVRGYAALA